MPLIDPFATRLTRAGLTRLNRQLEPQSDTIADRARSTGFAAVLEPLAKTLDAVVAGESMLAADRVTPEAAKVVVSLLESLPAEPLPVARDALESRRADAPAAREAAAVLAVSVWSILAAGQTLDKAAVLRVQNAAFGVDKASRALRLALLGRIDQLLPDDPLGGFDGRFALPLRFGPCLDKIGSALGRFGAAVQALKPGRQAGRLDADGISTVSPQTGLGPGDRLTLNGSFAPQQPGDAEVVVVSRWGTVLPCEVLTWSDTRIEVLLPCAVADGPVGFRRGGDDGWSAAFDPGAGAEVAGMIGECLGPGGARVAEAFAVYPPLLNPPAPLPARPPELNAGRNLIEAGPRLTALATTTARETDPPQWIEASGWDLRSQDRIRVGDVECPTQVLSPSQLRFRVVGIPAGLRGVVLLRGTCRTEPLPLTVEPVFGRIIGTRVRPGGRIEVVGTGFAAGRFSALLGGIAVPVVITGPTRLEVVALRTAGTAFQPDPDGEPVELELFDRGAPFGNGTVRFETIRLLTFGDSVAWGQGLLHADKFSSLVASRLTGLGMGVYEQMHAHSGAAIGPAAGDPAARAPDDPYPPGTALGENPGTAPSITAQVEAWDQPAWADAAARVSVVLLDGGINDVGVDTILDPFGSDSQLADQTRAACDTAMDGLLQRVRRVFPRARIVVTGYYPLVSHHTDPGLLYLTLAALGLVATVLSVGTVVVLESIRQRAIARSDIFLRVSNAGLADAVTRQGDPRVVFVPTGFRSENAVYGPQSFIWELTLPWATPQDPVAAARAAICQGRLRCNIASLGHPNVAGAMAMADAIRPRLGL
jgi:lysophospholipase L1-like esterase